MRRSPSALHVPADPTGVLAAAERELGSALKMEGRRLPRTYVVGASSGNGTPSSRSLEKAAAKSCTHNGLLKLT